MTVTIKDIARQGGVSTATVSRSLAGSSRISKETRERILQISNDLNYIPNLRARGLVTKRPDVLGIVIPRTSEFAFSNPFYGEILKGIGKKAREAGLYLLLSFQREEGYAWMFHHGLAAGIIVMANRLNDPKIQEAWKKKVPIVLIPGFSWKQPIPSIDADGVNGSLMAVNYLVKLGHKRIGILNGLPTSKYSIDRLAGYHKALIQNHLPLREEWIYECDFTQEGSYKGMLKLLSLPETPTAVLTVSDFTALGALRAAKERGYRVPEDLSIIGYGDIPFASMIEPPLTTLRVPYQRMGEEANDMLLKLIHGKRIFKKQVVLPVDLVLRRSTGPPAAKRNRLKHS
jgi:LacI family transcriptional regulator